jgi:RecA/RadA recombinase
MAKKAESKTKKFSIGQLSSLIDKMGEESKIIIENNQIESGFIGTGVYILNALFSKSILKGGVPEDRISILAGPPTTGKSYIIYNVVRNAQEKGYFVIFIDTEHSINKRILSDFGVKTDDDKLKLIVSNKVEDLKFFLTKFLDDLKKQKQEGFELPKILIALDSIGQLASNKEVTDALEGSAKSDLSRAKALKQLFRIINSDLGYLKIPMIASNHTYENIADFYPVPVMAGGK